MEYEDLARVTTDERNFTLREGGGEWLFTTPGCFTKIGNTAELRKSYLAGDAVVYGTVEDTSVYGVCELEGFGLNLRIGPNALVLVRGRLADANISGGTVILERGSEAAGIEVHAGGRLIIQRGAKVADVKVFSGGLLIKES